MSEPKLPVLPGDACPVPLCDLEAGRCALLERCELPAGEGRLLEAMGLTLGCRLVVRANGDPCIVEVRSTRIGLARTVAQRLLVRGEQPIRG